MCGIVGFQSKKVTASDLKVLKKVMSETVIRGKHASGIAWWQPDCSLQVKKAAVPITELLNNIDLSDYVFDGQISIISHARYSTSDIKYNQPLATEQIAIAHNGVISQQSSETWLNTYGYHCKTKNDSELLLKCLEQKDNPLEVFPDASIAAVILHQDGRIECMRNSRRPLWMGKIGHGIVYASTFDILNRAGVQNIQKVESEVPEDLQRRCMGCQE